MYTFISDAHVGPTHVVGVKNKIQKIQRTQFHRCPSLEDRILDQENPVSNPLAAVSKLGQFRSLHVAPVPSAV